MNVNDSITDSESFKTMLPGEKLREFGAEYCTQTELLAIIMGPGTKERSSMQIAEEIIDTYLSLPGLMGVSLEELMKIKGLNEEMVTQISAAFELAQRLVKWLDRQ